MVMRSILALFEERNILSGPHQANKDPKNEGATSALGVAGQKVLHRCTDYSEMTDCPAWGLFLSLFE
jgi:hypothetical protein